jgi:hypothetical protein
MAQTMAATLTDRAFSAPNAAAGDVLAQLLARCGR